MHTTDKEKFQEIKKYCKIVYNDVTGKETDNMGVVFPYGCVNLILGIEDESDITTTLDNLKSNDFGIDGFFIDHDKKEIIFLQFKAAESAGDQNIENKDLSYFDDIEKRLEAINQLHSNWRVNEIRDYFIEYRKDYKIRKLFCCVSNKNLENQKNLYSNIEFFVLDDIYEKYDYKASEDRKNPAEFIINFEEPENKHNGGVKGELFYYTPNKQRGKKTSFGIINGKEVIRLMETYGVSLFDKNIRYFLRNTSINKDMKGTIITKPKDFYYYNNGITVTCIKSEKKGEYGLNLSLPQIINGAQTLSSIFNVYQEYKNKGKDLEYYKDIKLLAMVIEVSKDEDKEFSKNITKYRNANNPIRLSDYKGNCKIQEKIQQEMYELGYFYMIKRGEDGAYLKGNSIEHNVIKNYKYTEELKNNFKALKLRLENVGTIMTAYKGNPLLAKQSPVAIFEEGNYKNIFGDNLKDFTKNAIKEIIIVSRIKKIIEDVSKIDRDTIDYKDKKRLEKVYDPYYLNYAKSKSSSDGERLMDFMGYLKNGKFIILAGISYMWKLLDLKENEEGLLKKEYLNQYENIEYWDEKILRMIYRMLRVIDDVYKNEKSKITFINYVRKKEIWENVKSELKELETRDRDEFRL
jgi:hypothetical protein